jgi:hypothetical protein
MSYGSGTLFPIYFIDPPSLLNTYVTNIPGSGGSPLQVVADSGLRAAFAIGFVDTTGDWIGIYLGPVGFETLLTIVGGGQVSCVPAVIPHNSRVSVRSMTATPITNGNITLTFLGQGLSMVGAS